MDDDRRRHQGEEIPNIQSRFVSQTMGERVTSTHSHRSRKDGAGMVVNRSGNECQEGLLDRESSHGHRCRGRSVWYKQFLFDINFLG